MGEPATKEPLSLEELEAAASLRTGRKHVLSILVEDKAGVLTRIAGLFARRGFNIDTLTVGPTEDERISRITLTVDGAVHPIDQVTKQLHKLVNVLKIRDLEPMERERYLAQWQAAQSRFVDFPKGAVTEADELVCSLMQTRGYPVADFDQRAADISVDHPRVVENYRSAHSIALRLGRGEASTEELRTAMIHYRSLFDELVQVQAPGDKRVA